MTCRFCPNCGHDIERYDRTISIGPLTIDAGYCKVGSQPVDMPGEQLSLLRILALAYPRPVNIDALILKMGKQDHEDGENLIRVHVCKLRRSLKQAGLPTDTVKTVWGRGYTLQEIAA